MAEGMRLFLNRAPLYLRVGVVGECDLVLLCNFQTVCQSNDGSYLCFMQKSSPKSALLYFLLSRKGELMHYLHGFSLSTALLSRLPETSSSPCLHIQHYLMGWHTNSLGGHFADYWMHFKPRDVFTRGARARARTQARMTPKSCSFDYCKHGRSVLRHRAQARWNGGHRHNSHVLRRRNRLGQVIKWTSLSMDVF